MEQYHPRRKKNEITDDEEKRKLLREGRYLCVAMCADGEPYIVTLSYGYDRADDSLYFHCANKGHKLDFLRKNPRVCATLVKDNGYLETKCDHDYESLVIRGSMRFLDELHEKKQGMRVILHHLENDPAPIEARALANDAAYAGLTMLKLRIESLIGKRYIA